MKSQQDHNQITLLVVRDAGRPVRQLRISRPMALAIPAAAALSISALVTSMHYHSSQSITRLEAEAEALTLRNLRMEIQVADKEEALQNLQMEVTNLSEEAESIKDKLKSVGELEQQLQNLIRKQGSETSEKSTGGSNEESASLNSGITTGTAKLAITPQVGGEYIAVHENEAITLVQETKDDFQEIRSILDEMVSSISLTISQAERASTLQAKTELVQKAKLAPASMWPTLSSVISSSFGYRTDPFKGASAFHAGIDIAGNTGDPVYAAQDGDVIAVDQKGARGKYIVISHPNGLETWYMHLSGMNVSVGDNVRKGEKIGRLGNTGRSTGPHLHFQVVKQNKPVNPLNYVNPGS
ncbi:peptidoglycan DD-metalloendopeptidase family protein [Paenibacillus sp. BR2-3]|uniref:peptidoglycan DD-metalloendopeptidase family protein n=1 Tax=Paenibacillus sp. BR2-3 TaxID=3048494 RepID=UPI003977362C